MRYPLAAFSSGWGGNEGENTHQKKDPNMDLNQKQSERNSLPNGKPCSTLDWRVFHMSPILNKATPNRSSTSEKPEKRLGVSIFMVLKIHSFWQDLEHLQLFQRNFDPTIIYTIHHLEMPKILSKTVLQLVEEKRKWVIKRRWWVVIFLHRTFYRNHEILKLFSVYSFLFFFSHS